ncbi:MAG TPA: fasciclin domain-containing protein [Steroidobacteraceae bacterium]|nr:fasciclin domain-containing protein [Steroidobacteraceae bacterium]
MNSRWLYVEDLFMSQSKSTVAGEQTSTHGTAPVKNIVDTAIGAGIFTTLTSGIKAAGLASTLTGKGPFTVFAPTDEAFKKLPFGAMDALFKDSAKLRAVLNYHVIPGHVTARDMKSGEVMTLQGSPLTAVVASSDVQVNGAHVRRADLVATNGVIHAIDTVIMPKNWQLLAAAA